MDREKTIKLLEELIQTLLEEPEDNKPKWEPKKGDLIEVKFTQHTWNDNPPVIRTFQEMDGNLYQTTENRQYGDVRRFLCPIQWIERKKGDNTAPSFTGEILINEWDGTFRKISTSCVAWKLVYKWRPITDDMEELRKVFEQEGQA